VRRPSADPARLSAVNNPKSCKTGEFVSWRHKNPTIVVKLPANRGNAKSFIVKEMF
jgi:hypothetical protein